MTDPWLILVYCFLSLSPPLCGQMWAPEGDFSSDLWPDGWPAVPQGGFCLFLKACMTFAFLQLLGTPDLHSLGIWQYKGISHIPQHPGVQPDLCVKQVLLC